MGPIVAAGAIVAVIVGITAKLMLADDIAPLLVSFHIPSSDLAQATSWKPGDPVVVAMITNGAGIVTVPNTMGPLLQGKYTRGCI